MAGSYNHCVGKDGQFDFELIENMGDAHEACAMMFHMIQTISRGDQSAIRVAEFRYYQSVNPTLTRKEFDQLREDTGGVRDDG